MVKLEKVIAKLLEKNKKTLATAESCTGGLLSHLLTNISGSSNYFKLGVSAYGNEAKMSLLKVPPKVIKRYGAVSMPVARLMAKSIRKTADSDFGIGITGIAGPGGGSVKKPIGTVFIAIDSTNKKICKKFCFKGTRTEIKKQSAFESLQLLKLCLKNN